MRKILTVLLLVLALSLVACGGGGEEAAPSNDGTSAMAGDSARGEELYKQVTIGSASAPGCVTCHSLEPDVVLVGPSHAGLANRAGEYQEGKSAEEYLRESIVDPDAHLVEGYAAGLMYMNYENDLSGRDINDIVAYLMTLE